MSELATVPKIGEDSYKNVKNFAISASREIPGQARNDAKREGDSREQPSPVTFT